MNQDDTAMLDRLRKRLDQLNAPSQDDKLKEAKEILHQLRWQFEKSIVIIDNFLKDNDNEEPNT